MFDLDKKNWREEEKKQGLKELKQLKEIVDFLLDQQEKYYYTAKSNRFSDHSFEDIHKKVIDYKSVINNFTKF